MATTQRGAVVDVPAALTRARRWRKSCASPCHHLAAVPLLTSRGELGGQPAQAGGPGCVALARWRAGCWVLPLAEADPPAEGGVCERLHLHATAAASPTPKRPLGHPGTHACPPGRAVGALGAVHRRRRRIRQLPGACVSLHRRRAAPAALAAVPVQVDTSSTRRRLQQQQMCIW